MKSPNKSKIPEPELKNNFDSLCQAFENGHFYGLEYILEDFFQKTSAKTSDQAKPEIDWFGLYH